MTDVEPRRPGKRVVTVMYVVIVALAGVFGYVVATLSQGQLDPQLFGVIALPRTPLGVALYGVITVGLILGVLLVLVSYVSKKTGAAGE